MLERFYPDYQYSDITQIKDEFFIEHNIKYVILDIDNTLVPYTVAKPSDTALAFIRRLQSLGIQVSLVSNNGKERVQIFNRELKLYTRHFALKPATHGLRAALRKMGANPQETAVIGDQVFTDIYGGNRLGATTILVEPLELKENRFFRWKRRMEQKVLERMGRKK